jgi:hypothetical protein
MSDGKRLNSSLDLLKRHYPQVASLRDYIYSILDNATEITLVVPDDPEEYRDLLENSMVGCHQPPCRKYRAGASVFEIDEVDTLNPVSAFDLHAVRSSKGRSGASSVPRVLCKKYHYRWVQGTVNWKVRVTSLTSFVGSSRGNCC